MPFLQRDYSQPKGVAGMAADDKNFSYYTTQEIHKRATAFLLWAEQGAKAEDYVVRDAAEFRGYVLAHLERAHMDWRKQCESPFAPETPNAVVYQVALALQAESGAKEGATVNPGGGVLVGFGMLTRCMPAEWRK